MKVLTAATGDRVSDFAFTIPGELVAIPPGCSAGPDCGCDRAFEGVVSRKATTVVVVADLETTFEALVGAFRDGLGLDHDEAVMATAEAIGTAAGHPVGARCRRLYDRIEVES